MEEAMKVNPDRKSEGGGLFNTDKLPATLAAKLATNVMPCISLDLVNTGKGVGPCRLGSAWPPYTIKTDP